jgi:chemotaxis response regulator CheB
MSAADSPRPLVCIEAVDGLDAIIKAKKFCPDLIILCLGVPEMNGFEAATVLQKTMPQVPLFHESPVVESKAASGNRKLEISTWTVTALYVQVSSTVMVFSEQEGRTSSFTTCSAGAGRDIPVGLGSPSLASRAGKPRRTTKPQSKSENVES